MYFSSHLAKYDSSHISCIPIFSVSVKVPADVVVIMVIVDTTRSAEDMRYWQSECQVVPDNARHNNAACFLRRISVYRIRICCF
jgi:hypothetical protein